MSLLTRSPARRQQCTIYQACTIYEAWGPSVPVQLWNRPALNCWAGALLDLALHAHGRMPCQGREQRQPCKVLTLACRVLLVLLLRTGSGIVSLVIIGAMLSMPAGRC